MGGAKVQWFLAMRRPTPAAGSTNGVSRRSILIIEDEEAIRFGLSRSFGNKGFRVTEADSCAEGERAFRLATPDVVLLDYCLPDGDGLDLLGRLRALDASVPVLLLTAHGSIDMAVRAIKEGAEQFLVKPVDIATLLVVVERLLDNRRNFQAALAGRVREARDVVDPFVGSSSAIQRLREKAQRLLASSSPVLILGETGTGKGVLARWIHQNGPRADETLVDLNCAGLSKDFLETELFGHEKGAFTGAVSAKQGLFEVAHRGTLFLDEIGDVDPAVQPKLLKVLEEQRFRRLGDVRDRRVDARLIAATHLDLANDPRFRKDLYYRVSALPLTVPPLRDRAEDAVLIAGILLSRIAVDLRRGHVRLTEAAERRLLNYPWPGNIREMKNVLERAVLLMDVGQTIISGEHLQEVLGDSETGGPRARMTLEEAERRHIERVLREEGGDVQAAAVVLGIARSSLYDRLRKYGVARPNASSVRVARRLTPAPSR